MNELSKTLSEWSSGKKVKLAEKREPLTYLELSKQKPKELPSFAPLIEEDFMPDRDWKRKTLDEKETKRKLKKVEKDALRELRKDTVQVHLQREKEQSFKKNQFRKSIIKGGQIKDEI